MPPRGTLLVTGAGGFIGSAVVAEAARHGWNVIAGLRREAALPPGVNRWIIPDLGAEGSRIGLPAGLDVVIHCAARAHQTRDLDLDPLGRFRAVNRDGTLRLAEAAAGAGVRRFIFLSSIGVLGERTGAGAPFTAMSVRAPASDYARAKGEAEDGLRALAEACPMEIVIIRPPLVCGAGAPGNFDRLLQLVASGIPLPFSGVENRRTFAVRADLVDLILTATDHPGAPGAPLLAGDPSTISTPDLLQRLARHLHRPARLFRLPGLTAVAWLPLVGGPLRKLTDSLEVDVSDTMARLDWSPRVGLDEGLAEMARAWRGM